MPSSMCRKPSAMKRNAAWCQRGSSRTTPGPPRREEAGPRGGAETQAAQGGAQREAGAIRPDGILQYDVEQRLAPDQPGFDRQPRAADVVQRRRAALEGAVGR